MANDWKLNKQGSIDVRPLGGWQLAGFAGMGVVLRLDYFASPNDLSGLQTTPTKQFVLTAQMALELAEALKQRAEISLQPPDSDVLRN